MKRSKKFYFKNEKELAKELGLNSIVGSGSGWINKEDMESETLLVQLKSTDSSSYRINLLDIKKLEYHADVSNKIPIFLIQFLKEERLYALVDVDIIKDLLPKKKEGINKPVLEDVGEVEKVRVIKSSGKARNKFYEEKEGSNGRKRF